ALPPPSLYDAVPVPSRPVTAPPMATQPVTPATETTTPAAAERAPAVQPGSVPPAKPAPVTKAPVVQPSPAPVAVSAEPGKPWYKRCFSWLTPSSRPAAERPAVTAAASMPAGSLNADGRAQYAYDSPNRAIRTGYGQCVRTGWWTPGTGSSDCEA